MRPKIRYCAGCFMFHPVRYFHRDRTRKSGYRYTCKAFRSETRPSDAGKPTKPDKRVGRKRKPKAQGALFT